MSLLPRPPGLLLAEPAAHFAASVGHVPGGRGGGGTTVAPGCQGLEGTGEPGAPLAALWDEESHSLRRGIGTGCLSPGLAPCWAHGPGLGKAVMT